MKRLCAAVLLIVWGFCALAAEKSQTIVYINGSKYYVHTVQPGETLYTLSKVYGVGEKVILESNPSLAGGLKAAENIRIPYVADVPEALSEKKIRKTFEQHFVSKGETLYGLSRRYEIPIPTIIEDNPNLDPIRLRLGERILIRKKKIGTEDEAGTAARWEEYRNSLNSVAGDSIAYHIVHPGETFYSLAHRFEITEAELGALNGGLKAADLKAGAMIRVPGAAKRADAGDDAQSDGPGPDAESQEPERSIPQIEFRALRAGRTLEVALMLPIAVEGEANANYLEFYQGFLLGLDSVKTAYGLSLNVTLYNTERNPAKIREIVERPEFAGTQLIVGPVYEEGLYPVVRFAEEHAVPVVSPLANITRMNSDVLFQLAPDPACKYEKIADLINGDKRITLIYSSGTDEEFEREMLALLGDSVYERFDYKFEHPSVRQESGSPSDLTPLLENGSDNVFIIMADNEVDVDRILAALASADTNLTARGRTAPRFVVLGNARWNRYNNLDRAMFFKNRVVFLSTYHAKRDAEAIAAFDSAYIRSFGALPTLYSYRGYDTAVIFCPAMFNDIEYDMEGRRYTPLQTTYVFGQSAGRDNHVNRNWTRVNYNTDFTITTE